MLLGVEYVAMIGYPNHSNKGDSAIWVGELILLEDLGIQSVYASANSNDYDKTKLREILEAHGGPENTAIMFHGGGNFGDIWPGPQRDRETVAADFPDYRIRSFPQTYRFYNQDQLERAQKAFSQHPDLQLTARDTKSYMSLQKDFGQNHKVSLLPDAATMLTTRPISGGRSPKEGILFLARYDKEGEQDHYKDKAIIEELRHISDQDGNILDIDVTLQDWIKLDPEGLRGASYNDQAWLRVNWTYNFLNQYELVMSDRLHVHILSTVWGIDHITVEEGSYGKLRSYHETWLSGCGSIVAMTQSVREGVDSAKAWYRNGRSF